MLLQLRDLVALGGGDDDLPPVGALQLLPDDRVHATQDVRRKVWVRANQRGFIVEADPGHVPQRTTQPLPQLVLHHGDRVVAVDLLGLRCDLLRVDGRRVLPAQGADLGCDALGGSPGIAGFVRVEEDAPPLPRLHQHGAVGAHHARGLGRHGAQLQVLIGSQARVQNRGLPADHPVPLGLRERHLRVIGETTLPRQLPIHAVAGGRDVVLGAHVLELRVEPLGLQLGPGVVDFLGRGVRLVRGGLRLVAFGQPFQELRRGVIRDIRARGAPGGGHGNPQGAQKGEDNPTHNRVR